jgi:hypothetical protein
VAEPVLVETGEIRVAVDPATGALVELAHRGLGISLIGEPRLAASFRLLLPTPGHRGRQLDGESQPPPRIARTSQGLVVRWDDLRDDEGTYDVGVELRVKVDGDAVTFVAHVENRGPHVVEELQCPLLGGLANDAEADDWIFQRHDMWKTERRRFYREFPSDMWSDPPFYYRPVTSLPWCSLFDERRRRGVYLGVHDPQPRLSVLVDGLHPNSAYPSRWPTADDLADGTPIGAILGWGHFPFVQPGDSWTSPPVVVHFHEGTWYEAADYYREWFTSHAPLDKRDSWLHHEDAWQSTIISFPDDTILYRFADLPQLARDAKAYGINVIQLDGWDVGGLDRGYPQYEPDPRLGTRQELIDAIAACQAEGVRVLLFANAQIVNVGTDLYREQLHEQVLVDHDGFPAHKVNWGYHTMLEHLGQGACAQTILRTEGPFQEDIVGRLSRIAELGADGLQIDKTNEFTYVDYAAGGDAGAAYIRGLVTILDEVKRRGRAVNPEFSLAHEAWLDHAIPIADAAYTRVFELDHIPVMEYTFPEYRLTNCLMGVDFGLANRCVQWGHIINFECDGLHGSTRSQPKLAEYVAELLRLRRRLGEILWYGRIADPLGIRVADPRVGLTAWHGRDGRRAVVLTHLERDAVDATPTFERPPREAILHQPFRAPETIEAPFALRIPPNRLAILEYRDD